MTQTRNRMRPALQRTSPAWYLEVPTSNVGMMI